MIAHKGSSSTGTLSDTTLTTASGSYTFTQVYQTSGTAEFGFYLNANLAANDRDQLRFHICQAGNRYTIADLGVAERNSTGEYFWRSSRANWADGDTVSLYLSASSTASLEAPGALDSLTAEAGDGEVALAWTAPTSGGAPAN